MTNAEIESTVVESLSVGTSSTTTQSTNINVLSVVPSVVHSEAVFIEILVPSVEASNPSKLSFGSDLASKIYFGVTQATRAYQGSTLVLGSSP